MVAIIEPKNFCFYFDLPKDVNKNLKHQIELVIKHNESLAENYFEVEINLKSF